MDLPFLRNRRNLAWHDDAVKPSMGQSFFARNWPFRLWLAAVGVSAAIADVRACEPSFASLQNWPFVLLLLVVIVVAPVLAFFLSLPVAMLVLGPLYKIRARMNGAPFHTGDYVEILAGPNCGRIVEVEAIWKQRGQVVVDLGHPRQKGVQFAFGETQLCRAARPGSVSVIHGGAA
jgi:hypothetical protein